MDLSTASDSDSGTSENLTIQAANDDIGIKNVPVAVAWRDSDDQNRFLVDLNFALAYNATTEKALFKLQVTTRLKKGPARPSIFLFVKPDQIRSLTCISAGEELGRDEELHRCARQQLGTSTYILRFELRSPPTFVVPSEHPYRLFRTRSQAVWRSLAAFAKDTRCFFLHFPMKSLSKARLVSFCKTASICGAITSLDDNIASLYGGKGGKVVDPRVYVDDTEDEKDENDDEGDDDDDGSDSTARARSRIRVPSDRKSVPPAYEERSAAGTSAGPGVPKLGKRRRGDGNSTDDEDTAIYEKRNTAAKGIMHAILSVQRAVDEVRAAQEAGLSKIMAKVGDMEERLKQLAEDHKTLADEVRTHMEPLWDELDGRLQSQEDREHVYIRDVVEETVDESIKEKMAEAVNEYFKHDDEGQDLIHEVVGEMIHEETRDFLQSQRFTGNFTLDREPSPT